MSVHDNKVREKLESLERSFKSGEMMAMNGGKLLSLASTFEKYEDDFHKITSKELIKKKIAVLASFSSQFLVKTIKLFLFMNGIAAEVYEGEYDSIAMELLNRDSELYSFNPEFLIILTHHTDIKDYPPLCSNEEAVSKWLIEKSDFYRALWNNAANINGCQIIQSLFITPFHRQLGNLEANYIFSHTCCMKLLNMELIRNRPPHVTFVDLDYLASLFGKEGWFDERNYFTSKQGFSFDAFGRVSRALSQVISAASGNVKKCLVLDLDNTLWGGIIGDDGLEGINLDPHDPVGESFIAFQKYVKELKDRGIILAVCSKNDEETAREPFLKHRDIHLKLDDIACFVANWNDKASNLDAISRELNIGIDSLVFFDDNPAEREIVRKFRPEVTVIDVPEDPALYVRALENAFCFDWPQITQEDVHRSDSYTANIKREELLSSIVDYDSYLKSLEMKGIIGYAGPLELQRFAQLINKSNQFNLRTKRYTHAEIESMRLNPDKWALIYCAISDKFSDYGIISCIILEKIDEISFINTWVMSCRVLKRGVEEAVMNAVFETSAKWGCKWVAGEYLPTKKNGMVAGLLQAMGFEKSPDIWFREAESEGRTFRCDLDKAVFKNHFIIIENERN